MYEWKAITISTSDVKLYYVPLIINITYAVMLECTFSAIPRLEFTTSKIVGMGQYSPNI